ncbi:MAG: FimB/Mfa2 family fimbrial subunit, partial [Candidatus Paraprevotella stercoravium]|nr:FimB/Mfa2 family fimbrial subunit [Candidatus Paraprevotella stercoravium]
MKWHFIKSLMWFCAVVWTVSVFTSCSLMKDDRDDCPMGLYLKFKYDYNLERADMFKDHVGAVDVFVFDENGKYVTTRSEMNAGTYRPLADPSYLMPMNLSPG